MIVSGLEEALTLSRSDNSHDRLRAARFFLANTRKESRHDLELWLTRENVGWVKRAIEIAISKCDHEIGEDPQFVETELNTRSEAYRLALREVASTMLHELEPRIGILDVKIRSEIPSYESSNSRIEMERLKEFFSALGFLRQATEASQFETFECSDLINEIIADLQPQIEIHLGGPPNTVFKADKGKLKMAISNGVRNAVESTIVASQNREPDNIVIAWGETDADFWIAVIDDGVGIGKLAEKAVKIGNTTKAGHFGMGLTIAQQAIQTLNGKLSITSPNTAGAIFELRWYK